MKKFAVLALLLAATACRTKTEYGRCVGIDDPMDSTLVYKYSARNIVVGILFFQIVVPPVIVVLNELRCPVDRKRAGATTQEDADT